MWTRLKYLILLCFAPCILFAQVDTLKLNNHYLKKYWTDAKLIATAPGRWDGNDWTKLAAISGATAALFFVDEPIQNGFQSLQTEGLDRVSVNMLEPFGAEYSLAIAGSFVIYGLWADDLKSQSTGLLAVESFVLASLLVRVPKTLLGRNRPDSGNDVSPFDFEGPFKGHGFPSGHTAAVFSVASVVATQYRETVWVPILSYSVATAAGLSRVYDNRHWLSDVVAGAAIGIVVGKLVAKSKINKRVSLIPYTSHTTKGIRLALTL